jgi:hypothetical protein
MGSCHRGGTFIRSNSSEVSISSTTNKASHLSVHERICGDDVTPPFTTDRQRGVSAGFGCSPRARRTWPWDRRIPKSKHGFSQRRIGKSGGARVIYLYAPEQEAIYLVMIYGKSQKKDLTQEEKNALRKVADEIRNSRRAR